MIEKDSAATTYVILVETVGPAVGVALLLICIGVTYFLTKWLTTSIEGVTKKLVAVSNLEIDPSTRIIESQSRIKEVNDIESG